MHERMLMKIFLLHRSLAMSTIKKKKKNRIFISPNASNYNTNMINKHRGGFPEGQTPVALDTLSNAEYNIKYLRTKTKQYARLRQPLF